MIDHNTLAVLAGMGCIYAAGVASGLWIGFKLWRQQFVKINR
ncbi:MAG: hypothetical protein ACREFH_05680 [Stellaceae bacterium]